MGRQSLDWMSRAGEAAGLRSILERLQASLRCVLAYAMPMRCTWPFAGENLPSILGADHSASNMHGLPPLITAWTAQARLERKQASLRCVASIGAPNAPVGLVCRHTVGCRNVYQHLRTMALTADTLAQTHVAQLLACLALIQQCMYAGRSGRFSLSCSTACAAGSWCPCRPPSWRSPVCRGPLMLWGCATWRLLLLGRPELVRCASLVQPVQGREQRCSLLVMSQPPVARYAELCDASFTP